MAAQKGRTTTVKGMKPLKAIKHRRIKLIKVIEVDIKATKDINQSQLDQESRWTDTVTNEC